MQIYVYNRKDADIKFSIARTIAKGRGQSADDAKGTFQTQTTSTTGKLLELGASCVLHLVVYSTVSRAYILYSSLTTVQKIL